MTRQEFLLFELDGRRWAIPAQRVKSVHLAMRMSGVPNAAALTEGVVDLGGEAVPVLDLRRWLRMAPQPVRASQHLVLCDTGRRLVALRVDRALGMHENLDTSAWKPFGEPGEPTRTVGAVRVAGELVVVQDLDALLGHADAALAQRAASDRGAAS